MNYKLTFMLILLFPFSVFAKLDSITWKGTYYQAVPVKNGISKDYCEEHSPGSFIHIVKEASTNSFVTDKGIKLDSVFFNVDKIDGIYLIHGSIVARGNSKGIQWQELIHYYLYKLSEAGITKGVWYSKNCKGLYRGIALKNNSEH